MLCDICHKNDATVHLTEIIDNQITELHLCEDCARQKGTQMEQHFGLADLLAGLADLGQQFEVMGKTETKCPNCGLSYDDFRRIGRLGCSECYQAFRDSLVVLLKRIHGSTQHLGRTPAKRTATPQVEKPSLVKQSEADILRVKLQKAVALEEFEQAARLRDKIRTLEAKKTRTKKSGEQNTK
ncbi:MAG: UvrB/UvrC motif-containing protein [Candidatus Omnitrophica bacterium]|nr:UvrB/UvrC motif-containing protein [Candidatus Omnitrophota bacterium]